MDIRMNENGPVSDRDDMERLAEGHDAALNNLIERHAGRLQSYLTRLLHNQEDAEDLTQETFVRVYENRKKFDSTRSFSTWLYTIATRLAHDRYRWRVRHPEVSLEGTDSSGGLSVGARSTFSSEEASPAQVTLALERAEAVRRAVEALPEDLRVPLVLAEYEDRSHADIAAILECTAKAVEMRLYRARHQLRASLAGWLQP